MKITIFIIGILLLLSSCETKKKELTNEEFIAFFNSFNPQWKQAIVSDDPAYIIDRYSDNAIIGPPDKHFIAGKESIQKHWTNTVNFLDDFWYETQHIDGNVNDVFYETGIAFAEYKINHQVFKDTTKYLFVWKKVGDNDYKILAEMFNSIPEE